MHAYTRISHKVHRIIPSKFPPISLFDWAESKEELEQIANLESLTNERIISELGHINLVERSDWVVGEGSTPLMAAFTHIGYPSRFSDGSFGVYYAADSLQAAIIETIFHRERFYKASCEPASSLSMREYITTVRESLIDITAVKYATLLNPNPNYYQKSQDFGKQIHNEKEWGIVYPSVRAPKNKCVAILRPTALTIPIQGCHLRYIWNGSTINEVYKESKLRL